MKPLIIGIAVIAITVTACNNGNDTASVTQKRDTSTIVATPATEAPAATNTDANGSEAMKEMVDQYLQIKNALVKDDGTAAATAGNAFVTSMGKMEPTAFASEKKKVWDDVSYDAKEMAEHIGTNAGKIEHQREHFDMLSKDMYDMVKTFGATQPLYQDFCPMYNDKKGATWLSETKEIKNPYLGKKMPTCGEVKEEIK